MAGYVEGIGYLKDRLEPFYSERDLNVDPSLKHLLSTKLLVNLDRVRETAAKAHLQSKTDSEGYLRNFQEDFQDLEFGTRLVSHESGKELISQYKKLSESLKSRRYSVDFDSTTVNNERDEGVTDVSLDQKDDEDESLGELRRRLLGKRKESDQSGNNVNVSIEKQIQLQDNLQEELIQDMSQLVSSLRQGAEAFQNALQDDSTVLKATEIGLQVTSKSLSTLGKKLKKYHNSKFGFFFYIGCTLAMLLGLVITFMIIKVFPKM